MSAALGKSSFCKPIDWTACQARKHSDLFLWDFLPLKAESHLCVWALFHQTKDGSSVPSCSCFGGFCVPCALGQVPEMGEEGPDREAGRGRGRLGDSVLEEVTVRNLN